VAGEVLRLVSNWVCALRIDVAKMRPVDAMFSSVFLGTVCVFSVLCSKRSGRGFIVVVW
jgi:hypothetical protein